MKGILVISFLVMITALAARETFSQACGVSTYTFAVYVRNGLEAKNLRYKIYPVKRKTDQFDQKALHYLFETFAYWWDEQDFLRKISGHPAARIESSAAERFIRKYDPSLYDRPRHPLEGTFKDGRVDFPTNEGDPTQYLLAISADGYSTVYVLSHIFGGCRQREDVILYRTADHNEY